jgi:hypothetical protein
MIYNIALEHKCHELTQCCINILAFNIAFHNHELNKFNLNKNLTPEQSKQILIRIAAMFRNHMPDMLDADHHLNEFMNKEYIDQNVIEKILDHRGQPNACDIL